MMYDNNNNILMESCAKMLQHKHQDPSELCNDCRSDIICSEASVAQCEAKLFCTIVERLCCEIKGARCLRELEYLINIANRFFLASASKERALGEVIASCTEKKEKSKDCGCE